MPMYLFFVEPDFITKERRIDNEIFDYKYSTTNKAVAEKLAREIRQNGFNSRITKGKSSVKIKGKKGRPKVYRVWFGNKRR